ncbi:MAG: hypothetical protein KGZ25_06045 [Planctomycetes bacterium]|nr:hypothetical protein [Planctomycetota bacterium]
MAYPSVQGQFAESERPVTFRSLVIGAFFCALLGVAIPYFDILTSTSELGGCHFPVGPIFSLTVIILLLNIPLKMKGVLARGLWGAGLGAFVAFVVVHLSGMSQIPAVLTFGTGIILFAGLVIGLGFRGPLNAKELLVIFSMMLICSGIPTFGLISQLLPMVTSWQYLSPDTGWADSFFNLIPEWLVVGDPQKMLTGKEAGLNFQQISREHFLAIKWFYEKVPEGKSIPWKPWIHPLITWGIFITFLYGYMFCWTSILRKQWVEREKLLFPLMQLPVEMAKNEEKSSILSPLFKNPYMLIGLAIPLLLHSILQFHDYFLGELQSNFLRTRAKPFVGTNFKAFGDVNLTVYFAVIGFCYLLSTEITLSVWLFWVVNRFQRVAYDWMGTPGLVSQPGQAGAAQFIGALVIFVLFGLWAARRHLWDVARKAFIGAPDVDDSRELIGYRGSLFGLIICLLGLIVWCFVMGMQIWVAIFVFFAFTIAIIGITRAVVEGGLLFVKIESAKPIDFIRNLTGTKVISGSSLTVLSFIQYVSMFDLKTLLMPALMHGCKARDTVNDRSKKTLFAFIIAIVIVIIVSGGATMWGCYKLKGANNVHGWYYIDGPRGIAFNPLKSWIDPGKSPEPTGMAFMVGGALVAGVLIFMRRSFPWWPLHPLGYIMSQGYFESSRIAFSFFLGWFIKSMILRFAGGRWFKKLRPLFLGLILGEFGAAGLWLVIGLILKEPGPRVFP